MFSPLLPMKIKLLGLEIRPKGWWDNYLIEDVSSVILKEHRINEDNEIVKDDQGKDM